MVFAGVQDVLMKSLGRLQFFRLATSRFDDGKIDAQISIQTFTAKDTELNLKLVRAERGARLANAWIESLWHAAL